MRIFECDREFRLDITPAHTEVPARTRATASAEQALEEVAKPTCTAVSENVSKSAGLGARPIGVGPSEFGSRLPVRP